MWEINVNFHQLTISFDAERATVTSHANWVVDTSKKKPSSHINWTNLRPSAREENLWSLVGVGFASFHCSYLAFRFLWHGSSVTHARNIEKLFSSPSFNFECSIIRRTVDVTCIVWAERDVFLFERFFSFCSTFIYSLQNEWSRSRSQKPFSSWQMVVETTLYS